MKINRRMLKKSRGVTPVIATVLLIGLVVVAGIGVAIVMFGTINTPTPIKIEVVSISNFQTTDNDIYVDRFSVTIHNTERSNIVILSDGFTLKWFNESIIEGWFLDLDVDSIIIPALNIWTIPLACDSSNDGFELTPQNDTIYIDVTIFPEDSITPRSAKTFKSDILTIGDTYGPVTLAVQSETNLPQNGLNLSLIATNFGSLDLQLKIEFSTDSTTKIYFQINGENKSSHLFNLGKFENLTITDTIFSVKPTLQAENNDNYLILIFLWNTSDNKLLSVSNLILTYQG
ncbi:MAG: archaellin/type IV pilin N-terminal domain-containing protein [Candidatus Hodarchaeales archaeon]